MTLQAGRIFLRPFCEADLEAVHAYASVLENIIYMPWGPNTPEDTRAFLAACMAADRAEPKKEYNFAIVLADSDRLIGGCSLSLDEACRQGELGWTLHRDFWRQGYIPEAGRSLLRFGFEELGLHRIYARCRADNYGSYRVMEKCGMRREAHFIQNHTGREPGVWYDEFVYALLGEEWSNRRKNRQET